MTNGGSNLPHDISKEVISKSGTLITSVIDGLLVLEQQKLPEAYCRFSSLVT